MSNKELQKKKESRLYHTIVESRLRRAISYHCGESIKGRCWMLDESHTSAYISFHCGEYTLFEGKCWMLDESLASAYRESCLSNNFKKFQFYS